MAVIVYKNGDAKLVDALLLEDFQKEGWGVEDKPSEVEQPSKQPSKRGKRK